MSCALVSALVAQDAARSLKPLYVTADATGAAWPAITSEVGTAPQRANDAAELLRAMPGAAIVRNGPQTGILQLRGLSGDRVAVRVDGMTITPACPNHMDPPLHYAAPQQGDAIELHAGIAPVSAGGDFVGGYLAVRPAAPQFADGPGRLATGRLDAAFLGDHDAWRAGADATVADADFSLRYRGGFASASDLRYPGGTVSPSGYELMRHDLTSAWRTRGGFVAVDAGYATTRDAGTPALPMDMIEDDALRFGLSQSETFSWGTIENRFYIHDIDHLMDNYSLRRVPKGAMAMKSPSSSRDFGWRGDVTLPRGDDKWHAGLDVHRNEFDAEQVAESGMFAGKSRDTFNDNRRSRIGLYVDREQQHSQQWSSRMGLRGDVVMSDAASVSNAIMPNPAINADLAAFNGADRSFTDVLPAAMAALRFEPDEQNAIELAMALRSRAPSMVERYLWTPLNASAGLADGRTYLGNLDLDPETSLQIALAFSHRSEDWRVELTPFYQNVFDYIQGMPIARNDSAGKPVLQYDNISRAELYGMELAGGYDIGGGFSIDATASYVRGRDRDNGGDLYRIAPLRGMLDLAYDKDAWECHLEWWWAAAQNDVSTIQDEQTTPGYGILTLRVAKTFAEALRVEVGVENLLDKRYADHLGGVNRVSGGDLAVGERIPSAGRFGYAAISWDF